MKYKEQQNLLVMAGSLGVTARTRNIKEVREQIDVFIAAVEGWPLDDDICGKACPVHEDKCSIVDIDKLSPREREIVMAMPTMVVDEPHEFHLCLADPNMPHLWREGDK